MNEILKKSRGALEVRMTAESGAQASDLKRLLESHGYRVALRENGKRAPESTRQHKPTLVVGNVVMSETGTADGGPAGPMLDVTERSSARREFEESRRLAQATIDAL